MQLGRKRALVVSGAVATLLGAGALISPSSAARCPITVTCAPIDTASEDLGILPDPTRDVLRALLDQDVFPDGLKPVYNRTNDALEPAEAPVNSVTTTVTGTVPRIEADVPSDGVPVTGSLIRKVKSLIP